MMKSIRHIVGQIIAALVIAFGALAMLMGPTASQPIVFATYQEAVPAEHTNVYFAARAPPMAVGNIAFAGAAVAEHGDGFVRRGQETNVASLGFDADHNATNTGVRPPAVNPTSTQIAVAERLGVDPRWVKADGSPDWPPNYGFDDPPTIRELQPGQTFDRYGGRIDVNGNFSDRGSFVAPDNVPFDQRSSPIPA
ncbi:TNT domain-containing protein [Halocynthiibacter styelae]|uniref:TNT domain-containing protein n=1 Tax=Halocynthiibacter styelae TaxID=2761955 RepID=UPI001E490CFC|nr:TNT domain-containing protein [Paenihalocynthiibacter styelae]